MLSSEDVTRKHVRYVRYKQGKQGMALFFLITYYEQSNTECSLNILSWIQFVSSLSWYLLFVYLPKIVCSIKTLLLKAAPTKLVSAHLKLYEKKIQLLYFFFFWKTLFLFLKFFFSFLQYILYVIFYTLYYIYAGYRLVEVNFLTSSCKI